MSIFTPQNPGIDLSELTTTELQVVQNIGGLGDPNADRILFWDDSAGAFAYLTIGSGLSITGTTITATGTIDGSGTTNELSYWVDSDTLGALAVATYPSLAEIAHVKGVTSALQTQLNAKQPLDTQLTAIAALADAAGVLTNDGAGNMSWAAAGAGANTALSNLASVAINTTLVSDTDNTDSLGTLSIAWSDLFLGNGAVINFTSSAGVSDVTLTHSSNLLTLAGGDFALGTNNITMTGSLGATGARLTKVWAAAVEVTSLSALTIGGTAILTSLTSPQFTTIELGAASDTTLARIAAGRVSIEGVEIDTISAANTLSNKTLTAPKFADLGYIADANGNELIILDTVASAVNEITYANAATGGNPNFSATGGDANIGIDFTPKGTGTVNIKGNSTQAGILRLYEDTDDGSNYSSFKSPALAANLDYTLPNAHTTNGYLKNDGSGGLSWTTVSGGSPGWTFVSYNTSTSGLTLTVSSLDLSAALSYRIVYQFEGDNNNTPVYMRINGITTSTYISAGWRTYMAATVGTESRSASTTSWWVDGGNTYKNGSGFVQMDLVKVGTGGSYACQVSGQHTSRGNASSNDYFQNYNWSGIQTSQTNVTSITLFTDTTTNANIRVWVFKAATS